MATLGDDQLDGLIDRAQITALVLDYAEALDSKNWDLLGACFVPEGTADFQEFGGRHEGVDAVVAFVAAALDAMTATQHMTSNLRIELDGDTARATSYVHAQHVRAGAEGGDNFTIGGSYRDELARTTDGWRFVSRVLSGTWVEGNPAVFS